MEGAAPTDTNARLAPCGQTGCKPEKASICGESRVYTGGRRRGNFVTAVARYDQVVERWDLRSMAVEPHSPEVLQSDGEGRSIVIQLPAGESLREHQVHE